MRATPVARRHIDRSRSRAWALQILYRWETTDRTSDLRQALVEVQETRRIGPSRLEYIRRLLDGLDQHLDAVDQEVVTESQASQLTDKELVQYIFHPGMTTAKTVSDVSGRGMGMDIVISKIKNLNGTVEVDSVAGAGTTVTIKLPLTLAIITSLLSKIGGEVYAIPLEAVNEIVTVTQGEINSIQGQKVITVRERVIPVYLLEQLLETDQTELKTHSRNSEEWTLIILGEGAGRLGLVVDELLGQEDIVIKSLAENYANVPGFAGATIMGDGRVAMILDPLYLQADSSRRLETAPEERVVQA